MKTKKEHELRKEIVEHIRSLDPKEPHIINVNARYGQYQIIVKPNHDRQEVEITGHIHHMYATPDSISAYPEPAEIENNLTHTVILRDITVHANYPSNESPEVNTSEYINLAGEGGDKILDDTNKKLPDAVEQIMEDDIARALEGGEDSVTY